MPWDSLDLADSNGKRRSLAAALTELFNTETQRVLGIDASVAKGRAYLAVRADDGQVRPRYLLLAAAEEFGTVDPSWPHVMYKHLGVEESPGRWPRKVAQELTTWEP